MSTPNKPTPEELKAAEEKAIKAAEELEGRQQLPQEQDPEAESAAKAEAEGINTPETTEAEEDPEAPEYEEEQAEPSEEEKEALRLKLEAEKKKSSASARENQKIYAKNRVINKALADAQEIPEPTEEELEKEYPDWDVMSDIEKELVKETVVTKRWRAKIQEASLQATKIEKWNESVETFVEDPETLIKNPELEGKTEEFKLFAAQQTNNSVPFNILVSAFLHENQTKQVKNKGRMFERGSGGLNEKPQPKSNKLTLEQGRILRETNYPLWKQKLTAGLIESDL